MPDIKELMGKLVSDPILEKTKFGTSVCTFRIACDYDRFTRNGRKEVAFADCFATGSVAEYVFDRFCKDMPIVLSQSMKVRKVECWDGKLLFLMDIDSEFERFFDRRFVLSEEQLDVIPEFHYDMRETFDSEKDMFVEYVGGGDCYFRAHAYDDTKRNEGAVVTPFLSLWVEEDGTIDGAEAKATVYPEDCSRTDAADFSWSNVDIQTAIEYLGIFTGELVLISESESGTDPDELISISELAKRITVSKSIDPANKLKYEDIAEWLFDNGYLIYSWNNGKKRAQPSEKGAKKGFIYTPRTSMKGEHYMGLLLNREAQDLVKANIEKILQRKKNQK